VRTPIDLLRGVVTRDACPVPTACPASLRRRRLLRLSMHLVGFVVPTVGGMLVGVHRLGVLLVIGVVVALVAARLASS
jgi:hypothetical protein